MLSRHLHPEASLPFPLRHEAVALMLAELGLGPVAAILHLHHPPLRARWVLRRAAAWEEVKWRAVEWREVR